MSNEESDGVVSTLKLIPASHINPGLGDFGDRFYGTYDS